MISSKKASLEFVFACGYLAPFFVSGAFPPVFCTLALIPLMIFLVCGDKDAARSD